MGLIDPLAAPRDSIIFPCSCRAQLVNQWTENFLSECVAPATFPMHVWTWLIAFCDSNVLAPFFNCWLLSLYNVHHQESHTYDNERVVIKDCRRMVFVQKVARTFIRLVMDKSTSFIYFDASIDSSRIKIGTSRCLAKRKAKVTYTRVSKWNIFGRVACW